MKQDLDLHGKNKEELIKIILYLDEQNKLLHERIKLLLSSKYTKKAEDSGQLDHVFNDAEITEEQTKEVESAELEITVSSYTRKHKKTGRKPLPESLPRHEIIYDISEEEKVCGCGCLKSCIGEEVSEQLEYIPAKTYVNRHIRKKYACNSCDAAGIVTASMPKQPIPKSIAGPGLLAQILVAKYLYHVPLYRQELMLQSCNVDISRATTSSWVIKCAELLRPLVKLLQDNIIDYDVSYADETRVQVLKESNRAPDKQSFMWSFSGGPPGKFSTVFIYSMSREHKIPLEFFGEDYSGYVHCDGYSGYETMSNINKSSLVGCMLHARRKFFAIAKISKKPGLAHQAIGFYNELTKVERYIKDKELTAEQAKEYRIRTAKPILDKFKIWLDEHQKLVPPKFPIGKAISYAINQWPKLTKYLEDGRLEWSNNLSERMMKAFATGRKNWLFCNSVAGANASAAIYSLIITCTHNNIEPYKWLRYVLANIPNCSTLAQLEAILPYNIDQNLLAE